MQPTSKYCSNCGRHTDHVQLVNALATRCTVCNIQTGDIERLQLHGTPSLTAPDGTSAEVVQNTPKEVVFYVATGEHKGYYRYDKQRKTYQISTAV